MTPTSVPNRLVFVRHSHSGGPDHHVSVAADTLRPLGCTCLAGQRGIVCWAALEVARDECYQEAVRRWRAAKGFLSDEFREAARTLGRVLRWRRTTIHVLAERDARPSHRRAA